MNLFADVKKIESEIEKNARKAGGNNEPDSNATSLDVNEQDIISTVQDTVSSKKDKTKAMLQELGEKRLTIQSELETESNLKLVLEDVKSKYESYKSQHLNTIQNKFKEYSSIMRQIASFKDENKLERDASYPESKVFKSALIALVFLAEVILNANMFSIGSVLGLLGGILTSIIISIINIGTGLLAGAFILRKLNHVDYKIKLKGAGLFLLYIILIPLLFNLLVAHYRAALAIDATMAFSIAPTNLFAAPFLIINFDAWVLFIVGLLVSVIACYEGYTFDDVYPEYGNYDRQYKDKRVEYFNIKKDTFEKLNEFSIQGIQRINSSLIVFSRGLIDYENKINESEEILSEFNNEMLPFAIERIRYFINKYRATNKKVRNSQYPEYFDEDYIHNFDNLKLKGIGLENSQNTLARLKKMSDKLENDKDLYLDKLSKLREELQEDANAWFAEIEKGIIQR